MPTLRSLASSCMESNLSHVKQADEVAMPAGKGLTCTLTDFLIAHREQN